MNEGYELIDVFHSIEDGVITYKGLPPPVITDYLTRERSKTIYAAGTEFQIGRIEMVANTGTYLDSPFHRYEAGTDLAGLDLYKLANLDGIVVRRVGGSERGISGTELGDLDLKSKAVLFTRDRTCSGEQMITSTARILS